MTTKSDRIVQLDPAVILAEDNIRYAITESDSADMQASIADYGSVHTPVEVYELDETHANGHQYGLLVGFRRYSAVVALNTAGADMTLPAIVVPAPESTMIRLKRQISENVDRKSMSPMDQARAIEALLGEGMTQVEARSMFKRPGGKKGEMVPMSNSWLNTTLSFLTLPKPMQAKIHSGLIGWSAAQELVKVTPEKRAEVLARAEADREAALNKEAKEDAKFTETESKLSTVEAEIQETTTALDTAKAELELAEKLQAAKQAESTQAYAKWNKAKKPEDVKAAKEHLAASEADFKAADKKLDDARKALAKLEQKAAKVTETAEQLRARLAEARKANSGTATKKPGRGKGDAVSGADVVKAATAAGAPTGVVKLTAADMRKVVEDLTLAGTYAKVSEIGAAFKRCFDGVSTPGELMKALAVITGEAKAGPKAAAAPAPKADALPPSTVVRPRTAAKK